MNRRELMQLTIGSALAGINPATAAPDHKPIRTGVKEFDELQGGLPPGSLTVLYGHHYGGKTTFAMNIAEHVALEEKRPVLYIVQSSRAQSAQTLFGQIACSRARVDWLDCAEGKLTAEEIERFNSVSRDIAGCDLIIDDTPQLGDAEIVQRIEAWADKHPGGLAIVDDVEQRENHVEVDRLSHALKTVAVKTNAVILGTAYYAPLCDRCLVHGVGLSHSDFSWSLFRHWCYASNLYTRDEADLSIVDQRTGELRIMLELRLDETLRRFHVVGSKPPHWSISSLRQQRLERPSGLVYHRVLKDGEEPPPGSRLVYMRGVHLEPEIQLWTSPDWHT